MSAEQPRSRRRGRRCLYQFSHAKAPKWISSKDLTWTMSNKSKIIKVKNPSLRIPPRHHLSELYLMDHNDTPIDYGFMDTDENKPEPDILNIAMTCTRRSRYFCDIKKNFMMLTDEQRKFVMHIYCLYKKNNKQVNGNPKIILLGPAGSGKTTSIDLIDKLITWDNNKTSDSSVKTKVLTFTHKAAAKIELEMTSVYEKIINSRNDLKENCIFFICDEISMVSGNLMIAMSGQLQQVFENDKLYEDRLYLLVGGLYDFFPIGYTLLPTSDFWTCCEFYELTKIIRQKDEKFITAMNNFKNSKMTKEDISLLRSREIEEIDLATDSVIHLFYKNKRVKEYNKAKLDACDGKEVTVKSLNRSKEWQSRNIRIKIGMRYMLTENVDVSDGLQDGTIGVVKDFEIVDHEVTIIWMDFNSTEIGKNTRSDYLSKGNEKINSWIPIQRLRVVYKSKHNSTDYIEAGNIFPLTEAEAITVQMSQGKTYPNGVCIHITGDPDDKLRTDKYMLYVALTRVQNLDDLYIFGNLVFATIDEDKLTSTENEFNQLRIEPKLKLAFETFEDKTDEVIIFLNTGLTFNEHYQFITTDTWYDNGSLLIFTETNTIRSDEVVIPNFEIAFRSNTKKYVRSGGGIICYKKTSKSIEVIDTMSENKNKMYLTLLLYEKYLYVLIGNKGDTNDIDFINEIMQFINEYVTDDMCIFFIGNLDQNLRPNLTQYLNDEKFGIILPCDALGKYDMILTQNFDIKPKQCGLYEYIPSAHKPMYVKLPPKPEMPILYDEPDLRQQDNLNELPVVSIPIKTENEFDRRGIKRQLSQEFETDDVVIFFNTGSTFDEHYEFITTDSWYDNGSLLIFTEANPIGFDKIVIPNFEIAYHSNTKTALKSGGRIICYKKTNKSVEVIDKGDDNLTLLLYEKYLYIVTGVKGDLQDIHFKNAIYHFIHAYVKDAKCIFFIGNLGPNLTTILTDFFCNERIKIKWSYDTSDPNQEVTQHDMILTRNFDINLEMFGVYKYNPSANKPVYVKLSPTPELLNSNGEFGSADNKTPSSSRQCEEAEIIEID